MKVEDIHKVAVIGVGLMGHGISQVFAQAGYRVCMQDCREKTVQLAFLRVRSNLQTLIQENLMDKQMAELTLERMEGTTDLVKATKEVGFVVEAVSENLDVKKDVFKKLDDICPKNTILASNTSVLSITEIGSATNRPEKVIGTHFWNPPHLVQAVEVVRGLRTSDETVETTRAVLIKVGKKPVVVSKDIPGQIGIRILYAMLREAISMIDRGVATAEDIDTVVKEALGTRLPLVGVLGMADLSGLDLVLSVSQNLFKDLERSTNPSPLIRTKVRNGELGVKTGRGFYDWTDRNIDQIVEKRDKHLIKMLKERK